MIDPRLVPLTKKQTYLKTLSEDDFRDVIVRPLFLLSGLEHGKDICGNDEDGKDCYFWGTDVLRGRILYVVQTKKDDLKMSSKARDNVLNAATQLRTALNTPVKDSSSRQTVYPDYAILAASGEINKKAQEHITNEIRDKRIIFFGSDELIPRIDQHMPELWYGIDVRRLPYLKRLREFLINQSDTIDVSEFGVKSTSTSPVTDDSFVQLYFYRYTSKSQRVKGRTERTLDLQELQVQETLKIKETVILITGEAGSGKTTTLRRLALILIERALKEEDKTPLPIFINAISVAQQTGRLVEIAADVTQKLSLEGSPAFNLEDLISGNVVLLLDAYDEIGAEDDRKALLKKIEEFRLDYPKCRLVLTSRDHPSIRHAMDSIKFASFRISPISFEQAGKMIERLSKGKSLDAEATSEILRRLDNIHGLELNPLLVTIFVATTDYSRTDIPANITELFKKFTELMLGRWDQSKGLAQQYQAQVKDFLLCRIGFTIHSRRHVFLNLGECREIIRQDLLDRGMETDVELLFDEIVFRSGLLKVDEDTVSFKHHLIQEFFAGRGIPSTDFLKDVISNYWWMRATVFHFGDRPGEGNAIQKLQIDLDTLSGTDLYQAAVALGTAIQACYLSKTTERRAAMEWVVHSMAKPVIDCLNFFGEPRGLTDSMRFIMYYMYGRDAVATKIAGDIAEVLLAFENQNSKDFDDICLFWCIAGLIESRNLNKALVLVQKFKPTDFRLLLALEMGAFYVEQSHITSAENKKTAKAIRRQISPKISHYRKDVMDEMKSMLLEIRVESTQHLSAEIVVVEPSGPIEIEEPLS